jgi:hypothetical protein
LGVTASALLTTAAGVFDVFSVSRFVFAAALMPAFVCTGRVV